MSNMVSFETDDQWDDQWNGKFPGNFDGNFKWIFDGNFNFKRESVRIETACELYNLTGCPSL